MTASHTGEAAAEVLSEFLERQRLAFSVVEDPKNPHAPITVIENFSKKSMTFSYGQVDWVQEARSPQTQTRYLRVSLDDGRSFALAGIGIVFAPSFVATGPLAECPPTASFRDFEKLYRHVSHVVDEHHEGHELEALQVFMVLLAFLDGARAIGLDVGEEERRMEPILEKLEAAGVSV
ncbi:MAG: hypothetical protein RMA76_33285 [Deltaproteobacteria bacterium]|jgi:hypothetical protein